MDMTKNFKDFFAYVYRTPGFISENSLDSWVIFRLLRNTLHHCNALVINPLQPNHTYNILWALVNAIIINYNHFIMCFHVSDSPWRPQGHCTSETLWLTMALHDFTARQYTDWLARRNWACQGRSSSTVS